MFFQRQTSRENRAAMVRRYYDDDALIETAPSHSQCVDRRVSRLNHVVDLKILYRSNT